MPDTNGQISQNPQIEANEEIHQLFLEASLAKAEKSPIKKAKAYKKLVDALKGKMTVEEIVAELGINRGTLYNYLPMLELPEELQTAATQKNINAGVLSTLAKLFAAYDKDNPTEKVTRAVSTAIDKIASGEIEGQRKKIRAQLEKTLSPIKKPNQSQKPKTLRRLDYDLPADKFVKIIDLQIVLAILEAIDLDGKRYITPERFAHHIGAPLEAIEFNPERIEQALNRCGYTLIARPLKNGQTGYRIGKSQKAPQPDQPQPTAPSRQPKPNTIKRQITETYAPNATISYHYDGPDELANAAQPLAAYISAVTLPPGNHLGISIQKRQKGGKPLFIIRTQGLRGFAVNFRSPIRLATLQKIIKQHTDETNFLVHTK